MDSNDWGTALGEVQMPGQVIDGEAVPAGGMEGGDWRTHLQQCSRQRIVDKIMETLKRHLPFSGQEGLQELKNIAIRFEEKIYSAATSQSDYLRKISLKMLTMETKSENPMANSLHSNAASNRKNPQDPVCPSMKLQMQNQVQQLPIPMVSNQSQVRQQILSQNIQNNIPSRGVPNSAGLNPAIPPVGGMSEETVPNVSVPNVNMQNMSNLNANAVGDSMGQGVPAHMYANSQRQILDRQQQVVSQVSRQKEPPVMHQQQSSMSQQLSAQQQQQLSAQQPSTANMQQNQMITQQKNMLDTQQIQQQQRIMAQQLQQQRIMQQQSNTLPGDTQQNIQSSGRMLQQKTTIDQQKELLRSSRVMPGVPLRFLDSSLQTGSATGGEWQEEIYQKIISMHKMYYPELNEMYQRMAAMLLQHDFYPQQPKNEQLEKLKFLKLMVERLIMFLRTNKNDIHPNHKEKIVGVEKQIVNFLNANWPREPVSLLQQGQLTQPQMHAMQQAQQQQPQVSQMHSNEGQMNTQMQPMNVQGSMMPTHQNYVTSLQHNTLSSSSSVSNSSQNMLDVLQLGSNIDPGQGSALYQLQSQRGMLQVPLNFTSKMGSATGGDTNQKRQQQYQQQLIHQQRLMLQQYMLRQPLMQKQQQQQQQPQQTSQQQSGRLPGQLVMVITASVLLGVLVLIMLHCGELVHA